jgi:cytochrome c oxidase subunit II
VTCSGREPVRSNRRRLALGTLTGAALVLSLTGCTQLELHGYLPGFQAGKPPVTNHTQTIDTLWMGSWIALLAVGAVVYFLIIFAAITYRRRRGETGLPIQLRYNMPIEVFFTATPLILILGLFAFTARDENSIEQRDPHPDVKIAVYGKQWAWDFNYVNENVYTAGVQAQPDDLRHSAASRTETAAGSGFVQAALPQLVLPVGKSVELQLRTRDVNHSFWVIDFLYKKDLIAGQTNYETVTPLRTGTFQGKCAELCGEYHSRMLFTVKVVTPAQYTAYIASLRARGNVGQLDSAFDRDNNGNAPGSQNSGGTEGGQQKTGGGGN